MTTVNSGASASVEAEVRRTAASAASDSRADSEGFDLRLRGADDGEVIRVPASWQFAADIPGGAGLEQGDSVPSLTTGQLDAGLRAYIAGGSGRSQGLGAEVRVDDNALLAAHSTSCQNFGVFRPPKTPVEVKMMSRLESDFRSFLGGLVDHLDRSSEEQAALIPSSFRFPRSLPAVDEADAENAPERLLRGIIELRQEPGEPKRVRYVFAAVLRNRDGDSVIAFDNFLNCLRSPVAESVSSADSGVFDLSAPRPVGILRISRDVVVGQEDAILRARDPGEFKTGVLLSPAAVGVERDQLAALGTDLFYGPQSPHRMPYLAKVVRHVVEGAMSGADTEIRSITPIDHPGERYAFRVETPDNQLLVLLDHYDGKQKSASGGRETRSAPERSYLLTFDKAVTEIQ